MWEAVLMSGVVSLAIDVVIEVLRIVRRKLAEGGDKSNV